MRAASERIRICWPSKQYYTLLNLYCSGLSVSLCACHPPSTCTSAATFSHSIYSSKWNFIWQNLRCQSEKLEARPNSIPKYTKYIPRITSLVGWLTEAVLFARTYLLALCHVVLVSCRVGLVYTLCYMCAKQGNMVFAKNHFPTYIYPNTIFQHRLSVL